MNELLLHSFHARLGARFGEVNGGEVVSDYGDPLAEHATLRHAAGLLDLSSRSRLRVTGRDRQRFLNGQVTNDVQRLRVGEGCYAALVDAKAKVQSDVNLYHLPDAFWLDFEPGLGAAVAARLQRYIIASQVRVEDIAATFGLLSVQGPRAAEMVQHALAVVPPAQASHVASVPEHRLGPIHVINRPRTGSAGFDVWVALTGLETLGQQLLDAVRAAGGLMAGWQALETARIEAGIPRFGADFDVNTLAPEVLDDQAISYTKGCYIGQEIIARVRAYGQVARALRGLRLPDGLPALPAKGDKLFRDGKEVGFVTSAAFSPTLQANLALGMVRREVNDIGTDLRLQEAGDETPARIVALPFVP